jgi:hypothetical protein
MCSRRNCFDRVLRRAISEGLGAHAAINTGRERAADHARRPGDSVGRA